MNQKKLPQASDMQTKDTLTTNTQNINKSTIYVALLTMITRILGFVRVGVISAIFGAGSNADILNLVLSIPNNLRKLLAEGALSNSYMPSYAQTVGTSKHSTPSSYKLFIELLIYGGIFTLLFVMVLSYFSKEITHAMFKITGAEQISLASNLFSLAIYTLFLYSLASMFAGLLQTHKKFIIPALSPLIMSIVTISMIILLSKQYSIFSVIFGYLVGGIIQIIVLAIPLWKIGYHIFNKEQRKLAFTSPFLTKELISVFKRFPTISIAVLLPMIGQQIAFYFTSTLQEGSSSAFSYAIVYWQLPIGVIVNAITSVAYTFLLTYLVQKNMSEAKNCFQNAIDKLLIFLLPISILFYCFAHAGIAVTLQRGNLTSDAAFLTAQVLQNFSLGLLPIGLFILFQKTLYALQKNFLVFVYTFIFTCLDILLSYWLIKTSLGVIGVSLAYTISLVIVVPCMYVHIKKYLPIKIKIIHYMKLISASLPLLAASILLSLLTKQLWYAGSTLQNLLIMILLTIILLSILIIGYRIIGINLLKFLRYLKKGEL